jgi:hypothetical protein
MEPKPTPAQYGLTEEAVARLAVIDSGESAVGLLWLASPVLCICLVTGGLHFAGTGDVIAGMVGIYGGFILGLWAVEPLLNLLFPQLKDYRGYREACKEYERRLAEHEHQLELKRLGYWRGLTYARLEQEVAALFRRMGHRAQVQGGSGDGGVDVAVDDDTIVQCKAYAKPLSPAAVRELLGTKTALGARRAILICTGGFTAGSRKFAESSGIELWDAHDLIRLHEGREGAPAPNSGPPPLRPSST